MSDGIRSGVNCTRLKLSPSVLAKVETSSVLASPGTPTSRAWPLAEHRDEQFLDDRVLADDDLAQFGLHVVIALLELFDGGQFVGAEVGCLGLDQSDVLCHVLLPFGVWFPQRKTVLSG